jgi:hypothetical protein
MQDKPVTITPLAGPSETGQAPTQASPGQPANDPPPPVSPGTTYEFITNAPPETRRSFNLFNGKSLPVRIALISGGLLLLFILLTIMKNALGGGLNPQPYISVMQDQQEMIHLLTAAQTAGSTSGLTASDQDFIANSITTFSSDQELIKQYLLNNKQKYTNKELLLKINISTDNQLTVALTGGTYTPLFRQTMSSQLTRYAGDLNSAYKASSGKVGRTLLNSEYAHVELLYKQLTAIK